MRISNWLIPLSLAAPMAGILQPPAMAQEQVQPAAAGDAELAAARALVTANKHPKAVAALEKFAVSFPQHPMKVEANALLSQARGAWADDLVADGKKALAAKDEARARDAFARALKLAEFDEKRAPGVGMLLGDLLFQQARYEEAAAAYYQVTRWTSDPAAPRGYLRMGDSHRLAGKVADAAISYRNGSELHWRDPLAAQLGLSAGDAYVETRAWRDAEAEYRRVLRLFTESPQAPRAQLGLARIAFLVGDYAVARASYQAARIVFAKSIGPEADLRIADTYLAEKDLAEARKGYTELLTSENWAVAGEARYSLGRIHFEAGEFGPASDHFAKLTGEKTAGRWSHLARIRLSEIRSGAGDTAFAVTTLQALLKEQPEPDVRAEAEFRLGRALVLRKDPAADAVLNGLIDRAPRSPWTAEANLLLADLRLQRGDAAAAVKHVAETLKAEIPAETRAGALLIQGRALLALKQEAPGVTSLSEVLEKHAAALAAPEAARTLADHFRTTGQSARAAEIQQLIASRYTVGTSIALTTALDQADRRLEAGSAEEARKLYTGILEQKPDRPSRIRARAGLAEATALLKQPAAAEAHLAELDRDVPSPAVSARTYARVGQAMEKSGETRRALGFFQTAYKAHQTAGMESTEGPAILLGLGRAMTHTGKAAEAEPLLREIVERHPRSPQAPEALYALAWTASDAGRPAEAQRYFTRLTSEHSRHPLATDAHYRLGEASFAGEAWKEAADHYRHAATGSGRGSEAAGYRLGWTLRRLKEHAAAAAAFQAAADRFPKGTLAVECRIRAGEDYLQVEQEKPSLTQFQAALITLGEPTTAEGRELQVQAKVGAAWASLLSGDFDGARALTDGLALPSNGWQGGRAQLARAESFYLKEGPKAALPEYRKAATLFGKHVDIAGEALFRAGECHDKLKNPVGARAAWQRTVDVYPTSEWAIRSREKLNAIPAVETTQAVEAPPAPVKVTPEAKRAAKPVAKPEAEPAKPEVKPANR